jgi:hypothetical protein
MPLLDGHDLAAGVGETFLLLTQADTGWTHVAMLSVGEVLAISQAEIGLALWPRSNTTENLSRTATATLMITHGGAAYYLRLRADRQADLSVEGAPRAFFVARIEMVLEDTVGYATITSGLRFRLNDPEHVLEGWRQTVEAMKWNGLAERRPGDDRP